MVNWFQSRRSNTIVVAEADTAALAACAFPKDTVDGVVGLAKVDGLCDGSRYHGYEEQGKGDGEQYRQRRRGPQHGDEHERARTAPRDREQLEAVTARE